MDFLKFLDIEMMLAAVLGLMVIILLLLLVINKKTKGFEAALDELEAEAAISMDKVENEFKSKEKELKKTIKDEYEVKIGSFKEYVSMVEKISRTSSEVKTHKILTDLKEKLVAAGTVKSPEMAVMSNVFLSLKNADEEMHTTKIDHLVLMRTGVYLIDTKEFDGNILYGATKEKAKEYSVILDNLFASDETETEKTIVIRKNSGGQAGVSVTSIDNPAEQVMDAVDTMNQLLENRPKEVVPIFYFDHHGNKFINYSEGESPFVFDNKETLSEFFVKQLEEGEKRYTEDDLVRIKNKIENATIT